VLCRHGLNTRAKRLGLIAPATPHPMSRHATPVQSSTLMSSIPASWSGSTASTSGGCATPTGRSGSSPRSTSPLPTRGQNWSCANRATHRRPQTSPNASPGPQGRWLGTQARIQRQRQRVPRPGLPEHPGPPRRAALPDPRRPSPNQRQRKRSTKRSSTNAGAPRSLATSTPATPASGASSTPT
jgi:hypothetical protein